MKHRFFSKIAFSLFCFIIPVNFLFPVSGKIIDSKSKFGLWGCLIEHRPSGKKIRSNKDGSFSLPLKDSEGQILINMRGYWPRIINVPVDPNAVITISLNTKDPVKLRKIVVLKKKDPSISKKKITSGEIRRTTANIINDTFKVLRKLPGVVAAGGSEFSSLLYIRGGNFYESIALLDDFQLINPYIFGGGTSVFNPNLVDSVDFYTGGFPSRFGQTMSGVIDVSIRNGNTTNTHGLLELSAITFEGVLEGPLGGKGTKSSYIIGLRRTHYDVTFGPAVVETGEGSTLPYFYDGQMKINLVLNKSTVLNINTLASREGADVNLTSEQTEDTSRKIEGFQFGSTKILQGFRLKTALTKKTSLKAALGYKYEDGDYYLPSAEQPLDITQKQHEIQGRADLSHTFNKKIAIKTGLYTLAIWNDLSLFIKQKQLITSTNTNAQYYEEDLTINYKGKGWVVGALYASIEVKPLSWLTAIFGARQEYFSVNKKFDLSPRFGLQFELDKKTRIKVAYGVYKQNPIYIQNGGALDETYGNPNLLPEFSKHYILGFEKEIGKKFMFRIEGFYKKYSDLVTSDPDSTINYRNAGEREAYGFDVFLQKKLGGIIDGWITYSYINVRQRINERNDPALFTRPAYLTPLATWYEPDFNRPHNLSLVFNVRLSKRWTLAISYTYSSGQLYTPLQSVESYTDGSTTVYNPVWGEYNSAKLAAYQRFDVKITMPFFGIKNFDFFIQAVNLFNNPNASGVSYNSDYTETKISKQLPRIALVGFRYEF